MIFCFHSVIACVVPLFLFFSFLVCSFLFLVSKPMDSIENMWQRFSLSDKEGLDVDLARTFQQPKHILVAKFLTTRLLNIDFVARTFKPLWKTRQSFFVQDLGRNQVAFIF